ncbi:MAG: sigma-70 family RNA polymerase sigma factor [Prevotellaceae bacterium]|jgi:RNA polymerase sigma-70 factor (ECF subfamily)|nr:sigma-70 family RNA polymerase sigma factor [Prevotellaceae bacterium]
MNNFDDTKLVQLFVAGSSEAFDVLLARHRRQVFGYILSMVKQHGTADDIFQETCIKVVGTLKRGVYKESGKFIAWFMRVAHNQVIDYFRSRRNDPQLIEGEHAWDMLSQSADRTSRLDQHELSDREATELRRLICYLSPEQREVLVMRYYMNMTHQAIADKLNIGLNTALGRMRYAIANLQKMVDKDKSLALHAAKMAS